MVSFNSLFFMVTTLVIVFLVPLVMFLILRSKSKNVTGAFIAGGLCFFISQMVLRIPILNNVLPAFSWYADLVKNPWIIIPVLAGSAALFEETARYLFFQLLLKDRQVFKCGIAFGIGHGGMEAIMLVGLTYVNNLVYSILINNNRLFELLDGKVSQATASDIYRGLTQTSPDLFLAAGIERVLTIFIHVGLTVLILEGIVRRRRLIFYLIAFTLHTVINASVLYLSYININFWIIELIIGFYALGMILYVIKSKSRFGNMIEAENEAETALKEGY